MSELFKHGDHIKPHYRPRKGQSISWAGKSTDEERPDGQISGIVKRYKKLESASPKATTLSLIKNLYQQAIEFSGRPARLKGLSIMGGIVGGGMISGVGIYLFLSTLEQKTIFIDGLIFTAIISLVGLWPLLKGVRTELFQLQDEPTIFDRENRKVYRIFNETKPGLTGLFRRWPTRAVEYDWNLIDVEHNAAMATTGSTITRYHTLIFIVRKSAEDPTIIDSFNIGNKLELGEHTVPAVWEHIRRFMEESGPHLPAGESVNQEAPQSFAESLGVTGPFSANYVRWWAEELPMMLLIHVLFPITIPFFLLWGFCNWLSYKTSIPVRWPQEVNEAVGSPITK